MNDRSPLNFAPKKRDPETERLKAEFIASGKVEVCPATGSGDEKLRRIADHENSMACWRAQKGCMPGRPKGVPLTEEHKRASQEGRERARAARIAAGKPGPRDGFAPAIADEVARLRRDERMSCQRIADALGLKGSTVEAHCRKRGIYPAPMTEETA